MIQMNLFPSQGWDAYVENGYVDTGKGRVGWTGRLGLTYVHYHAENR